MTGVPEATSLAPALCEPAHKLVAELCDFITCAIAAMRLMLAVEHNIVEAFAKQAPLFSMKVPMHGLASCSQTYCQARFFHYDYFIKVPMISDVHSAAQHAACNSQAVMVMVC
jgi:hypothetical protein